MAVSEARPANLGAGEFYGDVPAKRSAGSSILAEVVHKKAFELPEHSHELAYFTLVLGGSYTERFAAKTTEHEPLSLLWHRSGISHKDRIGGGGARCFTVEIKPKGMESLTQFCQVPLDFTEVGTRCVWAASRLYREFKEWSDFSGLIAEGLTLEMLGLAAGRLPDKERIAPKWLSQIEDRLSEEFADNVSTSALAEDAGVHPVHLASVFRKFHGQTIGEYVQRLRVAHAAKLMNRLELPLADIAYSAGFADQSHFNRLFKRHTGMTPGEFRRSLF